jgi:hypothetical protein
LGSEFSLPGIDSCARDHSTYPRPVVQHGGDGRCSSLTNEPNFLRFIKGRRETISSAAMGYDDDYYAALGRAVTNFVDKPSAPERPCRLETNMSDNGDPSQPNSEQFIEKLLAKVQRDSSLHSKTAKVTRSPVGSRCGIKNQREIWGYRNRKSARI